MEFVVEFIQNWGYIAVFLGALVEGESIILTASALAYAGYLNIYTVGIVAFIATVLADQSCYMIGRHYGPFLFDKFPRFKPAANRAFVLLKKIDIWFILTCRFVYGVRTISPFVIGAAHTPPEKFIPLNILAAFIWATVSCFIGYYLGALIISNFDIIIKISKEGGLIALGLVVVVSTFLICYKYCKKNKTLD